MLFTKAVDFDLEDNHIVGQDFIHYMPLKGWEDRDKDSLNTKGIMYPFALKFKTLKKFYKNDFKEELFIAHCNDTNKDLLLNTLKPKSNSIILIGPEGDFSQKEIEKALENGYKTITLGPNRLRTETAALYACMQAKLITK